MNTFVLLFFLILLVSALVSGGLLLIRQRSGQRLKDQEYIHASIFSFFTTLYAFFIGFAIVTLWSTFLTTEANVNREADAIITAYYTSRNLPNSEAFRRALKNYVKTVLEDEWPKMEQDSMSQEASNRFDDVLAKFSEFSDNSYKIDGISNSLAEAGRNRMSRATTMKGNLYPTVWIILIFGFGSVVFGLYLLNRQPTTVSLIFEFMVIFTVLTCLLFIYDINTPFSGFITVQPDAFQMIYQKMLSLPF
jgi:Zn-dependent protease with chaperone function